MLIKQMAFQLCKLPKSAETPVEAAVSANQTDNVEAAVPANQEVAAETATWEIPGPQEEVGSQTDVDQLDAVINKIIAALQQQLMLMKMLTSLTARVVLWMIQVLTFNQGQK